MTKETKIFNVDAFNYNNRSLDIVMIVKIMSICIYISFIIRK